MLARLGVLGDDSASVRGLLRLLALLRFLAPGPFGTAAVPLEEFLSSQRRLALRRTRLHSETVVA